MSTDKKTYLPKNKEFRINKVIAFLTLSDIFTWGLYLVITSLVGLYLATKLEQNAVEIVGIGVAIYNLAKGGFQIPVGMLTDKIKKDRDDILFLTAGNLFMGAPFLFYPLISTPLLFFVLQFFIGLGSAMNLVNWRKLFAKNLDTGKEGLEYGAYDTVMSLSMVGFSLAAGLIANISEQYFDFVMVSIGTLMISSGFWSISLFFVQKRKSN